MFAFQAAEALIGLFGKLDSDLQTRTIHGYLHGSIVGSLLEMLHYEHVTTIIDRT